LRKKAAVLRRALLLALALTAFAAVPAQAEIVADLGFRPNPDGFSFPNYGAGRANLNTVEMQKLFGRQVCLAGKGQSCVLRPGVRTLMRSISRLRDRGCSDRPAQGRPGRVPQAPAARPAPVRAQGREAHPRPLPGADQGAVREEG